MGWLTTFKHPSETASEFILSNVLTWPEDAKDKYRVLASAVVKFRTFYAAVERIDGATGERSVWASVILLAYWPNDRAENFGWKSMGEACGPNEAECPQRILDLLSPTDNAHALNWRERCHNTIREREKRGKICAGCTVTIYGKSYEVLTSLGAKGFKVKGPDQREYTLERDQLRQCSAIVFPRPEFQAPQAQQLSLI